LSLANAAEFRAKYWTYLATTDIAMGLPHHVSLGLGRVAAGLGPPIGLGIGTALVDFHDAFAQEWNQDIGVLPLSLYYVPYASWREDGTPLPIAYTALTVNGWLVSRTDLGGVSRGDYSLSFDGGEYYIRVGFGVSWRMAGFEAGYYRSGEFDYPGSEQSTFYGAVNVAFGFWNGLSVKRVRLRTGR
jgi:hypothetical protein